jgi:hypothetical protein
LFGRQQKILYPIIQGSFVPEHSKKEKRTEEKMAGENLGQVGV